MDPVHPSDGGTAFGLFPSGEEERDQQKLRQQIQKKKGGIPMKESSGLDQRSFILGMITAFCECVAGGCKRLALSPPLRREEYEQIAEEACGIIRRHGLLSAHEANEDQPEESRFNWILIAGKKETLDRYRALRKEGLSPAVSLKPFYELLSYQPAESIHTGYDAYRTFFG